MSECVLTVDCPCIIHLLQYPIFLSLSLSLLIFAYDLHVKWSPIENIFSFRFVLFCWIKNRPTHTQTHTHTHRIEWNHTLSLHSNLLVSFHFISFCFVSYFSYSSMSRAYCFDATLCIRFCCSKCLKMCVW